MPRTVTHLPLLTAPALAACQTLAPPQPDPRVTDLARSIEARSEAFHSALAASAAPACAYEPNASAYDELAGLAGQLRDHVTRPTLLRAANALARAVDTARLSHRMASAEVADPAGPCLAPGAIRLNAGAIARATKALALTQSEQEDR